MAADVLKYSIGNASSTTLSSSITGSDTSAPLTSDTNFAAKSGEGMALIDEGLASEEIAYATGKSGASLTIPLANRGLEGGSAQAHSSGASVKGILTAGMWNDLIDALSLIIDKTTGLVKAGIAFTTPKVITSINDTNNNELIKVTATGSAVNELTIANAATGNSPTISATGGDTDIDINLTPKGSGDVNIPTGVNIQINGVDPKRGIYVPASAMFPSTTAPCATLAQVESTTNDVNIKVLDFDGAGTSKEYAEFGIPSPSYWDASTVTATFYWYATAGSGTVNWEIQGLALADDDALDTAYGTLQEVTDTLLATGDVHVSAETSAVTIAGTPTAGDWVQFKVARDPANDTNTSDARLMGVRIRFGIAKYDDQ